MKIVGQIIGTWTHSHVFLLRLMEEFSDDRNDVDFFTEVDLMFFLNFWILSFFMLNLGARHGFSSKSSAPRFDNGLPQPFTAAGGEGFPSQAGNQEC